jgi:hypothetical protein
MLFIYTCVYLTPGVATKSCRPHLSRGLINVEKHRYRLLHISDTVGNKSPLKWQECECNVTSKDLSLLLLLLLRFQTDNSFLLPCLSY